MARPFEELLDERFEPEQRRTINKAARKKIRAIRLRELSERLGRKPEDSADKGE